jgi:hypothetical protein
VGDHQVERVVRRREPIHRCQGQAEAVSETVVTGPRPSSREHGSGQIDAQDAPAHAGQRYCVSSGAAPEVDRTALPRTPQLVSSELQEDGVRGSLNETGDGLGFAPLRTGEWVHAPKLA